MSVPQKKEPDASQVVSKPSLPFGWSCHVSKSVPGRCYYFNRFTNAKTWDLGELLPGHSDHASLDTAALPQSQHRFQDYHRKAVIDPSHGTVVKQSQFVCSADRPLPTDRYSQQASTMSAPPRPKRAKLLGPPLEPLPGDTVEKSEELSKLGVAELEALIAAKKSKLEEAVKQANDNVNNNDLCIETSSVESGFSSMQEKEEVLFVNSQSAPGNLCTSRHDDDSDEVSMKKNVLSGASSDLAMVIADQPSKLFLREKECKFSSESENENDTEEEL